MNFLVFPNQLFDIKYLPKDIQTIYLLEHPIFFGKRDIKMNFNQLKLILHRASMKYYQDELKPYKTIYIELKDSI